MILRPLGKPLPRERLLAVSRVERFDADWKHYEPVLFE